MSSWSAFHLRLIDWLMEITFGERLMYVTISVYVLTQPFNPVFLPQSQLIVSPLWCDDWMFLAN